ncbi:MAG: flagellar biosynthesis anti-sigma factor FlgM [Candidatus Carbobacillus sp.]|nr:flagellar biosynthesis anti-sigma factor FlgM [Candidatus Carbobacillus sp.]
MNIKPTDAHIKAYQNEAPEALRRLNVPSKRSPDSHVRPDRLELSQEASKLYAGGKRPTSDKLLELKHAIETGTYQVDASRVAEALLARLSRQEKPHA